VDLRHDGGASPTAAAARLVEPARTSPMANTLGWLVSSDGETRLCPQ